MKTASPWIFGLALLPALAAVVSAGDDKSRATEVDRMFARWDKPGSPGCAVGILRDGKLVHGRGYGMANLDDDTPLSLRSVFELGSMTKSFTCACLALLLDQGKIAVDDDVRRYVPELPRYDPPVRIRHLIRCECGLPDYFHLMQLAGWSIDDAYTDRDVLALLRRQKALPFKPGEKFSYTSSGYLLLAALVERVTGHSLARFARENVFQPLGMTGTHYDDDPTRVMRHRVVGYNALAGGGFRRWAMNSNTVGGWGLKSSVEDLQRWDQNFYRNRLPEGKHLREFLRDGTLLGNRNVLDAVPVERYRGLRRMQFTGGMPGFAAAMLRFPDQKFTVLCLTNDNWRVAPWEVASAIADLYLADQMKEEKPKPRDADRKFEFVPVPQSELANKVGAYRMKNGRIWKIALGDGHLAVTDHLNATYGLRALSPTRFRPVEGPMKSTFVFERPRPDAPFGLRLDGDGGGKEVLDPVRLVRPDAARLAEYVGSFTSDELQTTYRFTVENRELHLQVNNHRLERLSPTVRDTFIPHLRNGDDNRIITFLRDERDRVSGLTIDLWRVRGVRFVRQP